MKLRALAPDLPALLLLALACARPWLEASMARHMGIELPALVIVGWMAAAGSGRPPQAAPSGWNAHGLPGLLFALCVSGFWMLPVALDLAVLDGATATAKVASLLTAGCCCSSPGRWRPPPSRPSPPCSGWG